MSAWRAVLSGEERCYDGSPHAPSEDVRCARCGSALIPIPPSGDREPFSTVERIPDKPEPMSDQEMYRRLLPFLGLRVRELDLAEFPAALDDLTGQAAIFPSGDDPTPLRLVVKLRLLQLEKNPRLCFLTTEEDETIAGEKDSGVPEDPRPYFEAHPLAEEEIKHGQDIAGHAPDGLVE